MEQVWVLCESALTWSDPWAALIGWTCSWCYWSVRHCWHERWLTRHWHHCLRIYGIRYHSSVAALYKAVIGENRWEKISSRGKIQNFKNIKKNQPKKTNKTYNGICKYWGQSLYEDGPRSIVEKDRRGYLSFVLKHPLQVLAGTGGSWCPVGMYLHLPCSLLWSKCWNEHKHEHLTFSTLHTIGLWYNKVIVTKILLICNLRNK